MSSNLIRRTKQREVIMQQANYRKLNDHSLSSSTYHKKDGTNVRAILKQDLAREMSEKQGKQTKKL
jgi:hypothetical protein